MSDITIWSQPPPTDPSTGLSVSLQNLSPTLAPTPDLLALLLADKRSPQTKRAYEGDIADFLAFMGQGETLDRNAQSRAFCALPVPQITLALNGYKAHLRGRKMAEATINRRLAAIKSLLKFAHRLGLSATDGRGLVDGEKAQAYRDTRGVDLKTLKRILAAPEKRYGESLRALRDNALLLLLVENALRRAEVCALNLGDLEIENRALWLKRKGKGSQKVRVTLSPACVRAIALYLQADERMTPFGTIIGEAETPLFTNLNRDAARRGRLTPNGLYSFIADYGQYVGLKRLTPHMFRHSAITLALDAGLDVRKVQRLSGHAKLETLQIYDDNRKDFQGEATNVLSGLLEKR